MKVSIIGAGNVGSTTALMIAGQALADVALFDIQEDLADAKALDISQALSANNLSVKVAAARDYLQLKGSDIIVITAGFARKPGMSRDDLLKGNAGIVKDIAEKIKVMAPNSIIIVVTNPLDVMTYMVYKTTAFSPNKVFGMGGDLDSARFKFFISDKLKIDVIHIETMVLGTHGDLMVPVLSHTKVNKKLIREVLDKNSIEQLVERTRNAGAEIVSLLGAGSAYYGPAACVTQMVNSVLKNRISTHCVSAYLDGEYGIKGICIGVPVILGRNGIEKIIELDLTPDERQAFKRSAEAIKDSALIFYSKD